jgi:hypothetical protein
LISLLTGFAPVLVADQPSQTDQKSEGLPQTADSPFTVS